MPNRKPVAAVVTSGQRPELHLAVCRESSVYGNVLMSGMIAQTLSQMRHLPGVDDVLAEGIAPLLGTSRFETTTLRRGRSTAVLFQYENVIYLYSLGSAAAKDTASGENGFIQILIDVVLTYQPTDVWVSTFSRLLRSLNWLGSLLSAFQEHVVQVHCGSMTIDPSSQAGKAIWATLAMVADMERDAILQRLFAGRVHAHRSGRWVLGEAAVPPGYVLGDDSVVRVDPTQRDTVNQLLCMLADASLTSRQVMDAAGRLGISSSNVRRIHGSDATWTDIARADSKIASLIDWIPTYQTGVVEIFEQCPFKGVTQVSGLPVEVDGDGDPYVRFRYDWGLPDGGWAEPDILHAASQRARGWRDRRANGGAGHRNRRPLSGWAEWTDGDHEFRIGGNTRFYVVYTRPTRSEGAA